METNFDIRNCTLKARGPKIDHKFIAVVAGLLTMFSIPSLGEASSDLVEALLAVATYYVGTVIFMLTCHWVFSRFISPHKVVIKDDKVALFFLLWHKVVKAEHIKLETDTESTKPTSRLFIGVNGAELFFEVKGKYEGSMEQK